VQAERKPGGRRADAGDERAPRDVGAAHGFAAALTAARMRT
jgi:hypothetical protein